MNQIAQFLGVLWSALGTITAVIGLILLISLSGVLLLAGITVMFR